MVSQILTIINIGEGINIKLHMHVYYKQMQEIEWEIGAVGFTFTVWTYWGGANKSHLNQVSQWREEINYCQKGFY